MTAATAGERAARTAVDAVRDLLDLAVFPNDERDASAINERLIIPGYPNWNIPPVVHRGRVAHDASGRTANTWHRASECTK